VCRYGRDADFVKVLDFGLTKAGGADGVHGSTSTGARMGTAGYMAPEQIFGLEAGPGADLYALGCVAYWLLAGVKPFDAATAADLHRLHAQATPPPLSAKTPRPIPPRLESLILACLSKDPDDRPRNIDQLSHDLGCALDAPPWTLAESDRWWHEQLPEFSAHVESSI
jgi:serine/threonine-protein kinase